MWIWKILLVALVILHLFVVFVNLTAFFVVPFLYLFLNIPFWFSLFLVVPIESIIVYLAFNRTPCPLTVWENWIRKKIGMKEIGGFIGYYIVHRKWMKRSVPTLVGEK